MEAVAIFGIVVRVELWDVGGAVTLPVPPVALGGAAGGRFGGGALLIWVIVDDSIFWFVPLSFLFEDDVSSGSTLSPTFEGTVRGTKGSFGLSTVTLSFPVFDGDLLSAIVGYAAFFVFAC